MSQTIQPVSRSENVLNTQPGPQSSCLPTCVSEALQSIANLFSRIGVANLIGVSAIVLAASLFDALAGVVATVIFFTVKALIPSREPDAPPPQVATPPQVAPPPQVATPPQVTPPRPAPPVQVQIREEVLPPGTIRSRYNQRSIWQHSYDVNNLGLRDPDLAAALARPMPIRDYNNHTCCAMVATLIDYFYRHRFTDLTPIELDALSAKAIHVDWALRQDNPDLGRGGIEIFDFDNGIRQGELPAFQLNRVDIGIQENLIRDNRQVNTALFEHLLTEFLTPRGANGLLAGSLLLNGHFEGRPTGHFTGLYVDCDGQGQIRQIYVSDSSGSFSRNTRYNSGDNRWGAMVVPIGNTIEAAAAQLAQFCSEAETATLYRTVAPY